MKEDDSMSGGKREEITRLRVDSQHMLMERRKKKGSTLYDSFPTVNHGASQVDIHAVKISRSVV